jgi:nitrite reductase (NO-forming)
MKKYITVLIFIIPVIFSTSFVQEFDLKASIEKGKSIYETQCISCHMTEGEGIEDIYPPLAKVDYLMNKEKLVQTILKGVRGPIKILGKEYNAEMPGIELTDQETSDLINYVRNSFGNKAPAVLPKEIQPALKVKVQNYQPY